MKKVLLIGTVPPPIGGVTVHIKRFLEYEQSEYELGVLDIKKRIIFKKDKNIVKILDILVYFLNASIVHLHISNNIKILLALVARMCFKKVFYTHHNSRISSIFGWHLINILSHRVILVNDKSINMNMIYNHKTNVIPAFLPPMKIGDLPVEIMDKLNKYSSIISTNCFQYSLYNNKDLYGFDLIIDAFYALSKNGKIDHTLLVLVDPSGTTREYVEKLLRDKKFGTNSILYLCENIDFIALLKVSNMTIRATRTDGDSLSIRESLYYNIPIIASDVTWRPEGTIIFKNENIQDLSKKIFECLEKKCMVQYNNIDYGKKIFNLYREVTNV